MSFSFLMLEGRKAGMLECYYTAKAFQFFRFQALANKKSHPDS
jgi:hypothetical protein